MDLLLLGEIFLNNSVQDEIMQINSYIIYQFDKNLHSGKTSRGGLATELQSFMKQEYLVPGHRDDVAMPVAKRYMNTVERARKCRRLLILSVQV